VTLRAFASALVLSATLGFAANAAAEDEPPMVHAYARSRLPAELPVDGLVVDIGAGASMHPKQVGVSTSVGDPVPVLEVQWGPDFHASLADGVTFTPVYFGPVAVGGVLELRQTYSNPKLARGLHNADTSEIGGLIRYVSKVGDVEFRYRTGLDGDDTRSADLSYDVAFQMTPRLTVGLELRAAWSSEAFTIPQRRSRMNRYGRPLEDTSDAYSAGAQVLFDYKLSDNWRVIAVASKDEIVDAGRHVLQLKTRSVPVLSLVVTRRFRIY
jgi:outer membrane scaffolding protein for murein synthesis (MipA/OmpV family)